MPLPDCAGHVEIAQAHVIRVDQGGALILNDGRAILLEGVRLPGVDRPSDPIAGLARETLRELAMKAPLTLTATPPRQDRYDRVRVQGFGDVWLQTELLKRGLARVMIAPDRQECSPDFYEAEAEARSAGRGLWRLPEFAVKRADLFQRRWEAISWSKAELSTSPPMTAGPFSISTRIIARAFPLLSRRTIARRFGVAKLRWRIWPGI